MVKNERYYACFSCEVEVKPLPAIDNKVGIDLGVKHLAITSDGQLFESPKYLRKSEEKLKRLQRAVSKKQPGSNRRRKAVRSLAKSHENHHLAKSIVDAGWNQLVQYVTYKAHQSHYFQQGPLAALSADVV